MSTPALPDEDPDKSMETILASIRRIISEEEPAPADAAAPAGHDVLELDESMVVPTEPAIVPVVAVVPAAPPVIVPVAAASVAPGRLLAPDAQHAAARAFDALADANRGEPEPAVEPGPALLRSGGPTLEDIVRDELRGQLKSWLDANLAPLVQRLVQKEIDELRRRG